MGIRKFKKMFKNIADKSWIDITSFLHPRSCNTKNKLRGYLIVQLKLFKSVPTFSNVISNVIPPVMIGS